MESNVTNIRKVPVLPDKCSFRPNTTYNFDASHLALDCLALTTFIKAPYDCGFDIDEVIKKDKLGYYEHGQQLCLDLLEQKLRELNEII